MLTVSKRLSELSIIVRSEEGSRYFSCKKPGRIYHIQILPWQLIAMWKWKWSSGAGWVGYFSLSLFFCSFGFCQCLTRSRWTWKWSPQVLLFKFKTSLWQQWRSIVQQDQMSQRSLVFSVSLWMSKVKVLWLKKSVTQWVTRSLIELFWTAKKWAKSKSASYVWNSLVSPCSSQGSRVQDQMGRAQYGLRTARPTERRETRNQPNSSLATLFPPPSPSMEAP